MEMLKQNQADLMMVLSGVCGVIALFVHMTDTMSKGIRYSSAEIYLDDKTLLKEKDDYTVEVCTKAPYVDWLFNLSTPSASSTSAAVIPHRSFPSEQCHRTAPLL